jgi:hypothetical protein
MQLAAPRIAAHYVGSSLGKTLGNYVTLTQHPDLASSIYQRACNGQHNDSASTPRPASKHLKNLWLVSICS